MWILLLVEHSESPISYYNTMQTISTDALLLRQWKKNDRETVMNDAMYASSIPSYLSLSSPMSAYVSNGWSIIVQAGAKGVWEQNV